MKDTQQQTIRTAYGLSNEAHFTLLRDAIDNIVYKITTPDQSYVARISKSDKQAGMQFEAEVLAHLAPTVPVPQLVPTQSGASHLTVDGQTMTLFVWLPGESLEVDTDHKPSLLLTSQAGQLLGKIHAASNTFHPESQSSRAIDTEIQAALARSTYIEQNFEGGITYMKELRDSVDWVNSVDHNGGILHLDYIPSNLLVDGDTITGVLDFDWSCVGPFGKDLGLALAIWSLPDGADAHWDDVFMAFLNGYNQTASQQFARNDYLQRWISHVLLSETAMFLNDLNDKNEYEPESGKPITRIEQCRRYRKYEYFIRNTF